MASDDHSSFTPSLRLGLAAHQPLKPRHAQSLLSPLFRDPRAPHVLKTYPERAAPLPHRGGERRHAVGSHSALAQN